MNLHIVTPFSRIDNKDFYVKGFSKYKNLIWHPITFYKDYFIEEASSYEWIKPCLLEDHSIELNLYNPSTIKLNFFIQNYPIIENDLYCFIFDDDWIEEDLVPKILEYEKEEVIFISMKRGYAIPKDAPRHGVCTLTPYKNVKAGSIGFQQIFVKGSVLKQMEFIEDKNNIQSGMPDGYMAEWLQENFKVKYINNIYSYFNFLERGRWVKPPTLKNY